MINTPVKALVVIILFLIIISSNSQLVPLCVQPSKDTKNINASSEYSKVYVSSLKQEVEKSYLVFRTSGSSMQPAIHEGLNCLCLKKSKYNVGDIVVFFYDIDGSLEAIGHRIFYTDGENVITKGDNNPSPDNPIKTKDILCNIPEVPQYKLSLYNSG